MQRPTPAFSRMSGVTSTAAGNRHFVDAATAAAASVPQPGQRLYLSQPMQRRSAAALRSATNTPGSASIIKASARLEPLGGGGGSSADESGYYRSSASDTMWSMGGGSARSSASSRCYRPNVLMLDKNKGLRHFSTKVCDKVKEKGRTNYNEVADELVNEYFESLQVPPKDTDKQQYDMKNIRRRVYDALNVLMAMNIIQKEKKEIRWVGLPTSSVQECRRLEEEKAAAYERVEGKTQQIHELVEQLIAYKQLIARNREREAKDGRPSPGTVLYLPYLVLSTDRKSNVVCSISSDKSEYAFAFDRAFEVSDDIDILRKTELTGGLSDRAISTQERDRLKSLLPETLRHYVDEVADATIEQQTLAERQKAFAPPVGVAGNSTTTGIRAGARNAGSGAFLTAAEAGALSSMQSGGSGGGGGAATGGGGPLRAIGARQLQQTSGGGPMQARPTSSLTPLLRTAGHRRPPPSHSAHYLQLNHHHHHHQQQQLHPISSPSSSSSPSAVTAMRSTLRAAPHLRQPQTTAAAAAAAYGQHHQLHKTANSASRPPTTAVPPRSASQQISPVAAGQSQQHRQQGEEEEQEMIEGDQIVVEETVVLDEGDDDQEQMYI